MAKVPVMAERKVAEQDGFTITLSFEDEDMNMRDHFVNQCEWTEEQYNEIKKYYWFVAKVTAYKGTIKCGCAFLGGCCYKTLKDVLGSDINTMLGGYMPQLIEEAVEDANKAMTSEMFH